MRVKFLADYDPGRMAVLGQRVDRRAAAKALVADVGGKLKSVVVTYGEVDSMQFIAILPDGDAALEIAAAIQTSGGSLAQVTVLAPSDTRFTRSRRFEPRVAKEVGFGISPYSLGAIRT